MAKYIVTAKSFVGKPVGTVLELTDEQAKSALYRARVRLSDDQGGAKLEVASPGDDGEKEGLIEQLKALGISADKRSSVEKLREKLEEAQ